VRAAGSVLLAVAVAARAADATPYEAFIEIEDQADLEDLWAAGDLTEDTYEELLELLEAGVDLSTADRAELYALPNLTYADVDRILAYRDAHGGAIRDPAALVAAGVLSAEALRAIAPFLDATRGPDGKGGGRVRASSRFALRDPFLPPSALRARIATSGHVQAGFTAVLTRLELAAPVHDPNRRALITERRGHAAALPKAFLKYESGDRTAIAGSFRAGFGQRLVFDNSRRYTPNGLYLDDDLHEDPELERECRQAAGELAASPCEGAAGGRHVTPDYRHHEGLVGVGAGWKRRSLGAGWLQAYGWASVARRAVHQDELVDRQACPDPHDDDAPACDPPKVFVRPTGPILTPTSRFEGELLPGVFAERLAGVNLAYFADRRNTVGLTAYGAMLAGLVRGIELDTQEHSRLPTGRQYGAIGASFSFGKGWLDVSGEAALGIDRLPDSMGPQEGGGGPAGILRATATGARQELEAAVRYYSIDFANPYARPLSGRDEFDGQRARDEVGARLRYHRGGARLAVRALVDVWTRSSDVGAPPALDSYLRTDVRAARALGLGLWLRLQDRDLRASGHAQCFDAPADDDGGDERAEPISCSGRRLTTIGRLHLGGAGSFGLTALAEHHLVDDGLLPMSAFQDRFRRDLGGWLIALWRPDPKLRVRARARYLHEAANGPADDYLERSFAALLDVALGLRARDVLRARVDMKLWLDERAATLARSPDPELQLWLSYEAGL
jgi:hypothetical protein